MKLTKENIFRILAILTVGKFLLPVVFENLPFPLNSTTFYFLVWIGLIIIYFNRILISTRFTYIYFFAIWYFIFIGTGVFNVEISDLLLGTRTIDYKWIRSEIQTLFFSVLILQYFISSKDFKGLFLILKITLLFVLITLITTLMGLSIYPYASREMAGGLAVRGEFELQELYLKIGIAQYGFLYGLSFVIPALIFFLKSNVIKRKTKILLFIFTVLSIYTIQKSQHTTAMLFALIGAFFAIWTPAKIKTVLLRMLILLPFLILIQKDSIADMFLFLSNNIELETLQIRLYDMSITARAGLGWGTHVDHRYNRIPILLANFLSSPLTGSGETLGHNWWLDRLSMFGLLGTIPWVLVIWHQAKLNMRLLTESNQVAYLLSMLLFIIMGFMKNMMQSQMVFFVFFIIPAMIIIKDKLIHNNITKPRIKSMKHKYLQN
jgi:hypothetical protein